MKKYTCIAKTSDDKFVKYRLDNLLKFTQFMDMKWPGWRWFNVFDNRTKTQVANFTKNNRPISSRVCDGWYQKNE